MDFYGKNIMKYIINKFKDFLYVSKEKVFVYLGFNIAFNAV